ncbi:protein of unknown function [Proteiniborus ethanoligenes]|uniref:DUF4177 domain-containing protein n=1 Tax=Proteiniborus ethanoligenes TaxID=415015 RepID=A0A1H3RNH8_9FIRM|nr:DUF4177 domain-containing protein [Proteiniborus ethanoligenes]SDZ27173.1 protein of unknown function [Proteiniborus ethanoligenes]
MSDNSIASEEEQITTQESITQDEIKAKKKKTKNWSQILITTCLILILFMTFLIYTGQEVQVAPQQWEYKIIDVFPNQSNNRTGAGSGEYNSISPSPFELNELGSEGWELVTSYLEMETAYPNFGNEDYVTGIRENVRPQRLVLIYKRPITSQNSN